MKKILYIFLVTSLLGCANKDVIKGTAVSFYPNLVDAIVEGGTSSAYLELTGPGKGTVQVRVSDPEVVTTVPAMVDGVIELTFDGSNESLKIDIAVARANRSEDYTIDFEVVSVSGDISGIAKGTFSLFVTAIPSLQLPFFDDFESCSEEFATPEKWIEEFVGDSKADRGWACRATNGVDGSNNARASAFGGEDGTDDAWLITKGTIDLSTVTKAYMSFEMKKEFSGPGELFVWWSEDYSGGGDPTEATWEEIPGISSQIIGLESGNYKTVSADLNFLLGKKVYVAFQYVGGTSSGSIAYDLDNFSVSEEEVEVPNTFPIPFNDDLNTCSDFSIPANFNQEITPGSKSDRGWECSANGTANSQGVSASAFGGVAGTVDAWLISAKAFDLTATDIGTLSFDIQSRAAGSGTLNIMWSQDYTGEGDPSLATWNAFTGYTLPAGGSSAYELVEIDIASATGVEAFIAFQFEGGTNTSSISYDLDNIKVSADTGGGGNPPNGGTVIIGHDFEGCTTDFSVPDGFIEEVVPGSKTDRGWGCRAFGTDGSRAVNASSFGGEPGTDNAWLIMDAFDGSTYADISINFDVQSFYDGPGDLTVYYSVDYSGSGDPTAATWVSFSDVAAQLPAKGSQVFKTVTTAPVAINNAVIYLAFQFEGGTDGASASYIIDNLEVRGN